MADRIGVMYLGKMVELGSGDDIYERAAHPYTAGLIATIPAPDPATERAKTGAAIKALLGLAPKTARRIGPIARPRQRRQGHARRQHDACGQSRGRMLPRDGCVRLGCHIPGQICLRVARFDLDLRRLCSTQMLIPNKECGSIEVCERAFERPTPGITTKD